jgi:hypothetical protein
LFLNNYSTLLECGAAAAVVQQIAILSFWIALHHSHQAWGVAQALELHDLSRVVL